MAARRGQFEEVLQIISGTGNNEAQVRIGGVGLSRMREILGLRGWKTTEKVPISKDRAGLVQMRAGNRRLELTAWCKNSSIRIKAWGGSWTAWEIRADYTPEQALRELVTTSGVLATWVQPVAHAMAGAGYIARHLGFNEEWTHVGSGADSDGTAEVRNESTKRLNSNNGHSGILYATYFTEFDKGRLSCTFIPSPAYFIAKSSKAIPATEKVKTPTQPEVEERPVEEAPAPKGVKGMTWVDTSDEEVFSLVNPPEQKLNPAKLYMACDGSVAPDACSPLMEVGTVDVELFKKLRRGYALASPLREGAMLKLTAPRWDNDKACELLVKLGEWQLTEPTETCTQLALQVYSYMQREYGALFDIEVGEQAPSVSNISFESEAASIVLISGTCDPAPGPEFILPEATDPELRIWHKLKEYVPATAEVTHTPSRVYANWSLTEGRGQLYIKLKN